MCACLCAVDFILFFVFWHNFHHICLLQFYAKTEFYTFFKMSRITGLIGLGNLPSREKWNNDVTYREIKASIVCHMSQILALALAHGHVFVSMYRCIYTYTVLYTYGQAQKNTKIHTHVKFNTTISSWRDYNCC